MIGRAWEEQKAIKEVMVFLQGVGVSTSLAVRIYKKYGDGSISVVRNEPYRLAAEVWGIGFKTADTIAQAVGIPHDSPQRVQAGIQYTLSRGRRPRALLPARAEPAHRRRGDPRRARRSGPRLPGRPRRRRGGDPRTGPNPASSGGTIPAVYLVPFHRAETALAAALLRLSTTPADRMPAFGTVDWDKALAWLRGPDRGGAGRRAGAGGAAGADRSGWRC